jgi:transcriptional regulator with XRE-family HTH domain
MRIACGWKQIQIKEATGINPALISRAESGKLVANSSIIRKILQVFGIDPDRTPEVRSTLRVGYTPSLASIPLLLALQNPDLERFATAVRAMPGSESPSAPQTLKNSFEERDLVRALLGGEIDLALLPSSAGRRDERVVRFARILSEESLPLSFFVHVPSQNFAPRSDTNVTLPELLRKTDGILPLCFVKGSIAEEQFAIAIASPAVKARVRAEPVALQGDLEGRINSLKEGALCLAVEPFHTQLRRRLLAAGWTALSVTVPEDCFHVSRTARMITHDLCVALPFLARLDSNRPHLARIFEAVHRATMAVAAASSGQGGFVEMEPIAATLDLDSKLLLERMASLYPGFDFLLYPTYVSLLRSP